MSQIIYEIKDGKLLYGIKNGGYLYGLKYGKLLDIVEEDNVGIILSVHGDHSVSLILTIEEMADMALTILARLVQKQ